MKIDFKNIKIVIWDLDDTFWKGTLSEGQIEAIPENITLVHKLTDCGIINSICSKNDFEPTWEAIRNTDHELEDLFVFSSIDWTPKGKRISRLLKDMGLRPQNCLFIDDNIHNLEDAKFACPEIMTATPDIVAELSNYIDAIAPADRSHKRLKQYKILEKKHKAAESFDSNLDFLYSSNIRVTICRDCLPQIDRIAELVTRSNQLNFTKRRDSKEELLNIINDNSYVTGYVTVTDNFGDYGLVGFFAIKDNKCIHFLFSCRTIGQGVEEYVYFQLNKPELDIIPPVINSLENKECPKWINQENKETGSNQKQNNKKIVFKGACDLSQMCEYLTSDSIVEEFSYISESRKIFIEHHNHSLNYLNWKNLSAKEKDSLVNDLIFNDRGIFETSMYDHDVEMIILSTMIEPHMGIYRNKNTGFRIAFGEANHPLTDSKEWELYINQELPQASKYFTKEWLQQFSNEYEFCGSLSVEEIISNVDCLLNILPSSVKVCYVLGPEISYEKETNPTYFGRAQVYAQLNKRLRDLSSTNPRVVLIDVNNWLHKQSDFTNNINHWQRHIYYKMAEKANEYITELSTISVKPRSKWYFRKKKIQMLLYKTGTYDTKIWKIISRLKNQF